MLGPYVHLDSRSGGEQGQAEDRVCGEVGVARKGPAGTGDGFGVSAVPEDYLVLL